AHSAAYGLVSYWTAYLKANYPAEYMAALLTSVGDDKDKSALYLNECRRMKLTVLPPDVNTSEADFTPIGDTEIRFGLSAVRNVGTNVVEGIIQARKEKGPFTDFNDFLNKVPPAVCNKRVVESLIKAGAFDELGHKRKSLLMIHEQAIDSVIDIKRKEAVGQDSLFGALEDEGGDDAFAVAIPDGEEWDKMTLLAFEREMLGLYVSDHPLLGVEHILEREADCTIASLNEGERPDGQVVIVAGLLSGLQRKVTKQGNSWAMFQLEDLGGSIEVLCFPSTYQLCSTLLEEDKILVVKGKLDRREDVAKIIAMEVTQPDLTVDDGSEPFSVSMPLGRCTPPVVARLKEVLTTHPGTTEVHLHVQNGPRTTVVRLDDKLRVAPTPALKGDLKQLLGPSCLI
ncbi:MAG TPA: OB-fold nucleic acid binding domain-containing protein, partial [Spirillospora sp.]